MRHLVLVVPVLLVVPEVLVVNQTRVDLVILPLRVLRKMRSMPQSFIMMSTRQKSEVSTSIS